jgi:hypothetical protein
MRSCHDGRQAYRPGGRPVAPIYGLGPVEPPRVDLDGPDLVARLSAWVASSAADEAAAARSRERWLRTAAEESATFAGVLVDLAERGAPVLVAGRAGRRHRGVVRAVGDGFLVLVLADGSHVLLATAGVAWVRAEHRADAATGDRAVDLPMGLADALAALAEDRPRVLVVTTADDDGLAGELRAAGVDVLTLELDGPDRPPAYVPLATVAEVRLA